MCTFRSRMSGLGPWELAFLFTLGKYGLANCTWAGRARPRRMALPGSVIIILMWVLLCLVDPVFLAPSLPRCIPTKRRPVRSQTAWPFRSKENDRAEAGAFRGPGPKAGERGSKQIPVSSGSVPCQARRVSSPTSTLAVYHFNAGPWASPGGSFSSSNHCGTSRCAWFLHCAKARGSSSARGSRDQRFQRGCS